MKQNKQAFLYEFNEHIRLAKIDGRAKGLLQFYANVFNWKNQGASWYSQRQICALMGMSQSTYQEKRRYLENLGWLRVEYRGRNKPCKVWVSVGVNDPDYETRSWAQWHPNNLEKEYFAESETYECIDLDLSSLSPVLVDTAGESVDSVTLPPWFWD